MTPDVAAEQFGRFLVTDAPDDQIPESPMKPIEAMRLIGEDLILDGIPERNLATFVTTWMEVPMSLRSCRSSPNRPRNRSNRSRVAFVTF